MADDGDEAQVIRAVFQGAVHQGFGVSLDGRQWRAELVGNVDDEIAPHCLEPLQFGVLALVLGDGALEVFAGFVERLRELAEFAAVPARNARAEVAPRELASVGGWKTAGDEPAPEDAVNPDGSTSTRSMCRWSSGEDTGAAADWHIVPTRGSTFGATNSDEVYVPQP